MSSKPSPHTSVPTSTQNDNAANSSYSQEKLHYESLISLFKYCVGIFTVIGIVVGWLAYSNGQEMRQALRDERRDMEDKIKEMRADLQRQETELLKKEGEMKNDVLNLIDATEHEIKNARSMAVAQIDNIQGLASSQARNRIDEIFRDKNFENFVEDVAKERIEPRINEIVDTRFDSLNSLEALRVDKLVLDLSNDNATIQEKAYTSLQLLSNRVFSESQIEGIIVAIEGKKVDYVLEMRLLYILWAQKSPRINRFYKERLLNAVQDAETLEYGLTYTMQYQEPMEFYIEVLRSVKKAYIFQHFIIYSYRVDKNLTNKFLNYKPLVDLVFQIAETEKHYTSIENFKNNILETVNRYGVKNYSTSYFFTAR